MAVVTAEEFLALVEACRLLPATTVEAMRGRVAACSSLHPTYDDVASQWVLQGLLTAWQVDRILEGHGASLLLDKYKLLDQIGHGGMGVVFKAEHLVMGRQVALKMLFKAKLDNPTAVGRFHREVRALGKLDHPNIVVAHDAGRMGDVHYLVMEFIDGRDLSSLTKEWGRLPIAWACEFIRQAAYGLQHAHDRGMIHRDVKPANLLLTIPEPNARPVVKVLDLGLAKFSLIADEPQRVQAGDHASPTARSEATTFDLTDDDEPSAGPDVTADAPIPSPVDQGDAPSCGTDGFSIAGYTREGQTAEGLTQDGHILGTPDFLAPEQIHGLSPVDGRSDVFALGCTLFKLLTGQLPFGGDSVAEKIQIRGSTDGPPAVPLRRLVPEAPPGLEMVVAMMLARDAIERYQSPAEAAAALEPFCAPRGGWDRRASAESKDHNNGASLGDSYNETLRSSAAPTPTVTNRPAPLVAPVLLAPLPWLDPHATPSADSTPYATAKPATKPAHVTRPPPVVLPIGAHPPPTDPRASVDLPTSTALSSLPLPAASGWSSPLTTSEMRRQAMAHRRRFRKLLLIFIVSVGITIMLGLVSMAMRLGQPSHTLPGETPRDEHTAPAPALPQREFIGPKRWNEAK